MAITQNVTLLLVAVLYPDYSNARRVMDAFFSASLAVAVCFIVSCLPWVNFASRQVRSPLG